MRLNGKRPNKDRANCARGLDEKQEHKHGVCPNEEYTSSAVSTADANLPKEYRKLGRRGTEPTMSENFDPNSIRKTVSVQAPPQVAWQVFTEKMGTWWPLAIYKIGKANAVDAVIEPYVGGRWYERGDDGSTCQWGSVLVWEPHSLLVLTWDISADWQYDATLNTEIEVRFIGDGSSRTRVEFEHRRLDRYGVRRDEMRRVYDAEGDWGRLLEAFAGAAHSLNAT
jgi:uncharacterized protein YndB with AHSA1/START domain